MQNNAQLVERAIRIARELQIEPASPDEARRLLRLRGRKPGQLPEMLVTNEAPLPPN